MNVDRKDNFPLIISPEQEPQSRFIFSGIDSLADEMAKWSVAPTPVPDRGKPLSGSYEEVAEALSGVEIVDPHLRNLPRDLSRAKDNDLIKAVALTLAKVKILEERAASDERKKLASFRGKVLGGIGKGVSRVGGKKTIAFTSALLLVTAACEPLFTQEEPTLSPTQPTAGEVALEPTFVGPELPEEFIVADTLEEPTPDAPAWMPPTLEQALVKDEGGEVPEMESELAVANLQAQLAEQGVETELVEGEGGDLVFSHLIGSRTVELGTFVNRAGGYEFKIIKLNSKSAFFSLDSLFVDSETGRFSIQDKNGSKLFEYYHETGRWQQLVDFPYLTLSSPDGRTEWVVGESLENEVSFLAWNTEVPDLEYKDPENGETRNLTPEQRFQEAVYLTYWSLAKARHPDITLSQIRNGTTFTYEDNEGNIQTVDTSQPFRFIWTKTNGPGKRYDHGGLGYWFEVDNAGGMTVYSQDVNFGSLGVWVLFRLMSFPGGAPMRGEWVDLNTKQYYELDKALKEFSILLQNLDQEVWENPSFLDDYHPGRAYYEGKVTSIMWIGTE